MDDFNKDLLLGSAIQLIKDIERISFLGDEHTCLKIRFMANDWLKQLDCSNLRSKMNGGADNATD